MRGKEGSVLGFDAMIDLRDSGAIPNQVYNRSSRNNQDNSVTGWWEDVETNIDCRCDQIIRLKRKIFLHIGLVHGLSREKLEETYDSCLEDGTIQ